MTFDIIVWLQSSTPVCRLLDLDSIVRRATVPTSYLTDCQSSVLVSKLKRRRANMQRTSERAIKRSINDSTVKFEYTTDEPNRAPRTQLCNKQRPRAHVMHVETNTVPGNQLLQNTTQYLDILFEIVSQPNSVAHDSILI